MKFQLDEVTVYFPYEYIYPEQFRYMQELKRALDAHDHCLLEVRPSGAPHAHSRALTVLCELRAGHVRAHTACCTDRLAPRVLRRAARGHAASAASCRGMCISDLLNDRTASQPTESCLRQCLAAHCLQQHPHSAAPATRARCTRTYISASSFTAPRAVQMPTGTGKTITLLSMVTAYQLAHPGKLSKLVYCTRTVPEMEKCLVELRELIEYRSKYLENAGGQILALGLSSRKNLCIHKTVSGALHSHALAATFASCALAWVSPNGAWCQRQQQSV